LFETVFAARGGFDCITLALENYFDGGQEVKIIIND
jgi:hypothetical protein